MYPFSHCIPIPTSTRRDGRPVCTTRVCSVCGEGGARGYTVRCTSWVSRLDSWHAGSLSGGSFTSFTSLGCTSLLSPGLSIQNGLVFSLDFPTVASLTNYLTSLHFPRLPKWTTGLLWPSYVYFILSNFSVSIN